MELISLLGAAVFIFLLVITIQGVRKDHGGQRATDTDRMVAHFARVPDNARYDFSVWRADYERLWGVMASRDATRRAHREGRLLGSGTSDERYDEVFREYVGKYPGAPEPR